MTLSENGGVFSDDRIVCPFHATCFHAETGDVEDGPAFDNLPLLDLEVRGGRVFVTIPTDERSRFLEKREPCRHTLPPPGVAGSAGDVVVIGSGAAAAGAVETFLRHGHAGGLTVISKDKAGFWDRIKVSKSISATDYSSKNVLIDPSVWAASGVHLKLGFEVTDVDTTSRTVYARPCDSSDASKSESIRYDKLLCASGGPARTFRSDRGERITIPGAELNNIFSLRNAQDSLAVHDALQAYSDSESGARVVVIGSSFIGMEAAASISAYAADGLVQSIDIVGMEVEPFERVLGVQFGEIVRHIHEGAIDALNEDMLTDETLEHDSPSLRQTFHMQAKLHEFTGSSAVTGVRIERPGAGGKMEMVELDADIVVLGAGMIPAVDYLRDTDAKIGNGVRVDATLKACPHVWVAGDIAEIPNTRFKTDDRDAFIRVEHWDVAIDQGRCAARNMLLELAGKEGLPFDVVPFFWTQQHGNNIRYAGHAHFVTPENIIIQGNTTDAKPKLTAFFCNGSKVSVSRCARSRPLPLMYDLSCEQSLKANNTGRR
jgi:apoptosis-inducing factor 3